MDRIGKIYFSKNAHMKRGWDIENWRADLGKASKLFASRKAGYKIRKAGREPQIRRLLRTGGRNLSLGGVEGLFSIESHLFKLADLGKLTVR